MKNEVAAELCALLAFSAIKNNDKVSLVVFTDEIELFVPPGKGTTHVLRLIRELLSALQPLASNPPEQLPRLIRQGIQQLLAQLPTMVQLQQPATLQRAILDSGAFLEARLALLAQGAVQPRPSGQGTPVQAGG